MAKSKMNLFPAQPFDIDSIMKIERQAFIPQIQEKKKTFEKRLEIFPNGFLILSDASETAVKQNGNAVTCGYLCSEIWSSLPSPTDSDEIFTRKFKLGHNIKDTHDANGRYLYISSFAILRDYQGKGLGKRFFENSLAALCGAYKKVQEIVLLVNVEWTSALKIYEDLGFKKKRELKNFFPTFKKTSLLSIFEKKEKADAVILTAPADIFRTINFETTSENEFAPIKI